MKVAFNTGRHYTSHGQKVAAWTEESLAYFIDFDRMVYSYFPINSEIYQSPKEFGSHVMYMYDHGQYGISYIEGSDEKLSNVYRAGYDAFITDPDVRVINL